MIASPKTLHTPRWPMRGSSLMIACAAAMLSALLSACTAPSNDQPGPANPPVPDGNLVMCPMDVMQCPSGEWVGRQPPACQFVCPGAGQGALR